MIDCLSGHSYSDLSGNFWEILGFLANDLNDFIERQYEEPLNTSNVISDDLTFFRRTTDPTCRTARLFEKGSVGG